MAKYRRPRQKPSVQQHIRASVLPAFYFSQQAILEAQRMELIIIPSDIFDSTLFLAAMSWIIAKNGSSPSVESNWVSVKALGLLMSLIGSDPELNLLPEWPFTKAQICELINHIMPIDFVEARIPSSMRHLYKLGLLKQMG